MMTSPTRTRFSPFKWLSYAFAALTPIVIATGSYFLHVLLKRQFGQIPGLAVLRTAQIVLTAIIAGCVDLWVMRHVLRKPERVKWVVVSVILISSVVAVVSLDCVIGAKQPANDLASEPVSEQQPIPQWLGKTPPKIVTYIWEPTAGPKADEVAEETEVSRDHPTEGAESGLPRPTTEPTGTPKPTGESAVEPTEKPTEEPMAEPTGQPKIEPSVEPSEELTVEPTVEPTWEPTIDPTEEPTQEPTIAPTEEPTVEPTAEPTVKPTIEPTEQPTEEPTIEPTVEPTEEPTVEPTADPTEEPTVEPTEQPTEEPTVEPTVEPTEKPTVEPTEEPICIGFAQHIVSARGVQDGVESLCEPDGNVAEVGLEGYAELILDMGVGNDIVDLPGGDFYYFEWPNGSGIYLDLTEIAVAPDNGSDQPDEDDFTVVFVWGDDDPSNNGTIPAKYLPEIANRRIFNSDLHKGTAIGIDIGNGDGMNYRFMRIRTYPSWAVPSEDERVQLDAIEKASFDMNLTPTPTPGAIDTPTPTPEPTDMPAPDPIVSPTPTSEPTTLPAPTSEPSTPIPPLTDTPTPGPTVTLTPTSEPPAPTSTPTCIPTPANTPDPIEPLMVNVDVSAPECIGYGKVKVRILIEASGGQKPYTYSPARNSNYFYEPNRPDQVAVEVGSADGQHWSDIVELLPFPCEQREDQSLLPDLLPQLWLGS